MGRAPLRTLSTTSNQLSVNFERFKHLDALLQPSPMASCILSRHSQNATALGDAHHRVLGGKEKKLAVSGSQITGRREEDTGHSRNSEDKRKETGGIDLSTRTTTPIGQSSLRASKSGLLHGPFSSKPRSIPSKVPSQVSFAPLRSYQPDGQRKSVRFSPLPSVLPPFSSPPAPPIPRPTQVSCSIQTSSPLQKFSTLYLPPASYNLRHNSVLSISIPYCPGVGGEVVLKLDGAERYKKGPGEVQGTQEEPGLVYRFSGDGEKISIYRSDPGVSLATLLTREPLATFSFGNLCSFSPSPSPATIDNNSLTRDSQRAYRMVGKVLRIVQSRTPLASLYHFMHQDSSDLPTDQAIASNPSASLGPLRIKLTLNADLTTYSISHQIVFPSLPISSSPQSRPSLRPAREARSSLKLTISPSLNQFIISLTITPPSPRANLSISAVQTIRSPIFVTRSFPFKLLESSSTGPTSALDLLKPFLLDLDNTLSVPLEGTSVENKALEEHVQRILVPLVEWITGRGRRELEGMLQQLGLLAEGTRANSEDLEGGPRRENVETSEHEGDPAGRQDIERGGSPEENRRNVQLEDIIIDRIEKSVLSRIDVEQKSEHQNRSEENQFELAVERDSGEDRRFIKGLGWITRKWSLAPSLFASRGVNIELIYEILFCDGEYLTLTATFEHCGQRQEKMSQENCLACGKLTGLEVERKGKRVSFVSDFQTTTSVPGALRKRLNLSIELLRLF